MQFVQKSLYLIILDTEIFAVRILIQRGYIGYIHVFKLMSS